jgi:small subunit ribosomal protein S20
LAQGEKAWRARPFAVEAENGLNFKAFPSSFPGNPGNFHRRKSPAELFRDCPMANIASARKRARQAVQRNAQNSSQRSTLRTAIKSVRKAIGAGDKAAATQVMREAQSVIDRISDKRILHKNAASRYKSRLAAAIKAMA